MLEKECLPVVYTLAILCPHLMGISFTVYLDHILFHCLNKIVETSVRLMRWRLSLAEFAFTVM